MLHSFTISFLLLCLLLPIPTLQIQPPTFREAPKFYNSKECSPLLSPSSSSSLCLHHATHVAMTLDEVYLRGSMAAILSILQHSSCPENIIFHFVSSASTNSTPLSSAISSSFPYLRFSHYKLDDNLVAGFVSTSIRPALDSPLNYARTYLASLLPSCVSRIVYLDSDLILVDDIARLAATPLGKSAVLAAPEYCSADLRAYFTPTFWASPPLSAAFSERRPCYFNTGVMVMELRRWRSGGYTAMIEEWMEVQKRMRIYELGSLPPFLLVFAGRIVGVDHRWNQHGLGGDNYEGLCRGLHPGPVSLLHWSGKGKPWVRLGSDRPCPLDALWAPYDLFKLPLSLEA